MDTNSPITIALIAQLFSFGGIIAGAAWYVSKLQNEINKLTYDINNIAKKNRLMHRNTRRHINSHCTQLTNISTFLDRQFPDYVAATKIMLPEDED